MSEAQKSSEIGQENRQETLELSQEADQTNSMEPMAEDLIDNQENTVAVEAAKISTAEAGQQESDVQAESPGIADEEQGEWEVVVETLQQENAALKQQLEAQTQQTEALKSQHLRHVADFENFRKRTQKEKEEIEYQIKKNTITELLSVIDNFERARTQIKPNNDGEMTIHKSYQGVYRLLVDSLKRIGVSAMRPEGQEFDPNYHEAVLQEETDEYPEGTVMEQLQRGYLLGDKILRHAMVKVATTKQTVLASEEGTKADVNDVETAEN